MGVLPELGLVRSDDLGEVLGSVDAEHVPYAGGTELVPAMGMGLRRPAAAVDLKQIEARGWIAWTPRRARSRSGRRSPTGASPSTPVCGDAFCAQAAEGLA